MAITYSFIDNETYGTDDINAITASLTGAGVAPFTSKSSYTAADLNGLTSAITASGANLGGCLCTKSGTTVTVSEGIIFFENGVRLTVDSDGYTVTVPESTAGVICACFNNSTQTADILFAQTLPTSGYIVKLAEIAVSGAITDCRTYARSKVATFGSNIAVEQEMVRCTPTAVTVGETNGYIMLKTQNVDISKFNYAIFSIPSGQTAAFGVLNLKTNTFVNRAFVWYGGSPEGSIATFRSSNLYNGSEAEWYIQAVGSSVCFITSNQRYSTSTLSVILV